MARHKIGTTKKKAKAVGKVPRKKRARKVGGFDQKAIMKNVEAGAGVGLGIIAGHLANAMIVKQFPNFSPIASAVVQFGAGILVAVMSDGSFVPAIGLGLSGQGVAVGAQAVLPTGTITGPNDSAKMLSYRTTAGPNYGVIAGRNSKRINGPNYGVISAVPGSAGFSAGVPRNRAIAQSSIY